MKPKEIRFSPIKQVGMEPKTLNQKVANQTDFAYLNIPNLAYKNDFNTKKGVVPKDAIMPGDKRFMLPRGTYSK